MRPVELGESLVPGTGLTLIRKKLKRSFVLLRVVSYKDVPKKEQAWFGLNYCSYAVRDQEQDDRRVRPPAGRPASRRGRTAAERNACRVVENVVVDDVENGGEIAVVVGRETFDVTEVAAANRRRR